MLRAVDSLLYRFRTTMASGDADEAQADVAQVLREAAERLEERNPDQCADFSDGVDWVLGELRTLAQEIDDAPATTN
jgi:hypothetical protein